MLYVCMRSEIQILNEMGIISATTMQVLLYHTNYLPIRTPMRKGNIRIR